MAETKVLRKDQLELSLQNEEKLIQSGKLKEDNPLDLGEPFRILCEACRRGDLKVCQEQIAEGVNINARDLFDYTPLTLASLCGHYEVVQLLLDSGALCERDTFEGERCLYNALNDRIRNLLLRYDYSKSTNPLQPFAAHLASLLVRDYPQTSDIVVTAADEAFRVHKFVLSARSPYFCRKLSSSPGATSWKLPNTIPSQAFSAALKYLYLGEMPRGLISGPGTGFTESEVLAGIDKIAKHLELRTLLDTVLETGDRRLARQRRTEEIEKGRDQMEAWFRDGVIRHKIVVDSSKANDIKWGHDNGLFADVLLRADEYIIEDDPATAGGPIKVPHDAHGADPLPVGLPSQHSRSPSTYVHCTTVFPAHRAMLIRSEFFLTMFSSGFREAQMTEHLQIIPVCCSSEVLEIVLTYLYTEKADIPLELAVDVLFAADLLLIEKLKSKAALVISTLGNGSMSKTQGTSLQAKNSRSQYNRAGEQRQGNDEREEEKEEELIDIYEIIRAAWLTRVQRLEEFAARYLAYRLESHIDLPEFEELILESATRIEKRQETDTIELLDDIRYYLSERFRLRFEDAGLDEMLGQKMNEIAEAESAVLRIAEANESSTEVLDIPNWGSQFSPSRQPKPPEDEGVDLSIDNNVIKWTLPQASDKPNSEDIGGVIRTLDGEIAGDEFAREAINYQILLNKLDRLLEKLHLDA